MKPLWLKFSFLAVIFSFFCASSQALAQNKKPRDKSLYLEQAYDHYEADSSVDELISKRGIEIFLKNSLINQAYEFLHKRGKDVELDKIKAVIVDLEGAHAVVHFLGTDAIGGVKGVFSVEFKGSKAFFVHYPKLSPGVIAMYEVYRTTHNAAEGPCKLDYNNIIIRDKQIYYNYGVVSQAHRLSLIAGGHYRLAVVKKDGKWAIEEYRPYDSLCVPVNKAQYSKADGIHLSYPAFPNEIHSFLSLQNANRLIIKTGKKDWIVSKGIISRYEPKP